MEIVSQFCGLGTRVISANNTAHLKDNFRVTFVSNRYYNYKTCVAVSDDCKYDFTVRISRYLGICKWCTYENEPETVTALISGHDCVARIYRSLPKRITARVKVIFYFPLCGMKGNYSGWWMHLLLFNYPFNALTKGHSCQIWNTI